MSERVVCGPRRAELAKTFRRAQARQVVATETGGRGSLSESESCLPHPVSRVSCHVSPPSLLQVYQSARVDGLLIFSNSNKTQNDIKLPVSAPPVCVARLLFAPYSTFLVPPPVYAKEGYGGGISMDGFTST